MQQPDSVAYLHLPPYLGAMHRLLEDAVTTENVEQHIADYLAKLSTWFTPEQIASTEPGRAVFLESVRGFAAYEVGGRGNSFTAPKAAP